MSKSGATNLRQRLDGLTLTDSTTADVPVTGSEPATVNTRSSAPAAILPLMETKKKKVYTKAQLLALQAHATPMTEDFEKKLRDWNIFR